MKGVIFCVWFFILFAVLRPLQAQNERKRVSEGNQLYAEEKYDEANNKYQDALLSRPESPEIQFNVGNVLYKKKDFEKSLEAYRKSLNSDDVLFQSQAYYNMGNSFFRGGKLAESIVAYEQALKLNPDDVDAKYNLEFVRNQLKQNAQPEQQEQQRQQEGQQNEQQNENQPDEQQEKQEEQQEQPAAENEQVKEMSKEEAERLLEALKEDQKDMKKKQAKRPGRARVVKDW